jgi:hypothetical protein
MKCSIIKKRDGQLWELHSDEYDTIGDARVILLSLASELNGEWWSYDNDELMYDVFTYKITKSSSIHYDHSYGANDYITIK